MEKISTTVNGDTPSGGSKDKGSPVKTSRLAITSFALSLTALAAYAATIVLGVLFPANAVFSSPLMGPAGGLILLLSFFIFLAPAGYFTGRRALKKIKASDGTLQGGKLARIGTITGGVISILIVLLMIIPFIAVDKIAEKTDTLVKARQSYEEGDFVEAFKLLKPLAEDGVTSAQVILGIMCAEGRGVARDDSEAVRWFRAAADKDNSEAQSRLGGMYLTGRGVSPDSAEAVRWFRKAADQGHPYGQNNLGKLYALGEGVDPDDAEAVRWLLKSAKQGNELGQYNLAEMYAEGRGVPADIAVAVEWYFKAGNSFLKLGYRDDAERCLEAIRKYEPGSELGKKLATSIAGVGAEPKLK